MNQLKILLGQKIKEYRKIKGLTQEQLAECIGIGTANISYIENGKFAPSIENFEKIAKALDVEPYELYNFGPTISCAKMREKLFEALENNERLLKQMYNIYLAIKN